MFDWKYAGVGDCRLKGRLQTGERRTCRKSGEIVVAVWKPGRWTLTHEPSQTSIAGAALARKGTEIAILEALPRFVRGLQVKDPKGRRLVPESIWTAKGSLKL